MWAFQGAWGFGMVRLGGIRSIAFHQVGSSRSRTMRKMASG
jgi:hypothetical protein